MLDKVKQYLNERGDPKKRYLLGLSGGPDSMFLFYQLLKSNLSFSVIHVDHQVRKESAQEATELSHIVQSYGIPFYLKTLSHLEPIENNLEDALREKRYAAFKEIYEKLGASGIFLGHQREDQVETVLKRIFEGATIASLGGISPYSIRYGMEVHRPLLPLSKKEILLWLKENQFPYFLDKTNEDEKYLRARFRKTLIPNIEQNFGKEIQGNLYRFGENMQKVWAYISHSIQPTIERIVQGQMGVYLPLPIPLQVLELEIVLREIGKRVGIVFSFSEIEQMTQIVLDGRIGKGILRPYYKISLEKGGIFLFSLQSKEVKKRIEVKKIDKPQDWKDFFLSESPIFLPDGEYALGDPLLQERLLNGVTLGKWYSDHGVPIFFRDWFPVIYKDGALFGECLTGKTIF